MHFAVNSPRSFFNRERYIVYHSKSILFPSWESVISLYSHYKRTSKNSIEKRERIKINESSVHGVIASKCCNEYILQFRILTAKEILSTEKWTLSKLILFTSRGSMISYKNTLNYSGSFKLKRLEFEKSLWHSRPGNITDINCWTFILSIDWLPRYSFTQWTVWSARLLYQNCRLW